VKGARVGSALTFGVAATIALSGCVPLLSASAGISDPESQAVISVASVAEGQPAEVNDPVVVTAEEGRLTSVQVNGTSGAVPGTISDDGATWTSEPGVRLPFAATYEVVATAVDSLGRPAESVQTFSTVAPASTVVPGTRYVTDYAVYGVGMPIPIVFKTPVTERQAVEDALNLRTSVPVEGAWSWDDDGSVVTFRPKDPWPAGTKVDLTADLYGMKLNDTKYAEADLTLDYSIGDAVVMNVDVSTLTMQVMRNGQMVYNIPVTIGKPGYETHDGIKVISAKEGTITMRSPPGDPDFYITPNVEYSMRLTDHGEYLHAAPWSNDAFGRYANSHGCISMTTDNARNLWNMSREGDMVVVRGTGYPSQADNGISVWNETWEQWLTGSATGAHVYGPEGLVQPVAPAADPPAAVPPAA
jgi:lipoprotein-anchoring transpeptidase ErfK/SrfK